jgi:hypothetical protein
MPEEMMVAPITTVGGQAPAAYIVVAHPGQEVPSPDRLRHELGITDPSSVKPISEVLELRPATNEEIAAAGGQPRPSRGPMPGDSGAPRTAKRPGPEL